MGRQAIIPLECATQRYAWGGYEYIPDLLGIDNSAREPFAEIWVGAHAKAPAQALLRGRRAPLNDLIAAEPSLWLGERVAQRFGGRLPFLLKALDVREALSIQVHPTKEGAEKGFAAENAQSVPMTASHRNYKDDNHKPEVMVALTDFWLLHGFKPETELVDTLKQVPELAPLLVHFDGGNYRKLYEYVMTLAQSEVNAILEPLMSRLSPSFERGELNKFEPGFWAARAHSCGTLPAGQYDRGLFSIYLFNLVHCSPGEGVFQDAGILHAYLEGVNIELMANSDNVLRGGLTPKHVDVPELLKHVRFEAVRPNILMGEKVSDTERAYRSPAPDFELSRVEVKAGGCHSESGQDVPAAWLVVEGRAAVCSDGVARPLEKGSALFIAPHTALEVASENDVVIYKATVPKG